jgi:RNA polymerase sigma factor for flagellar operon FliA
VGRIPEESEIAAELNLTVDEYRQRLTGIEGINIGEMEYLGNERDSPVMFRYRAATEEESPAVALERAELERLIASSIDRMPRSEKTVLSLYFFEELTLREIAEVMGVHLSRVSQIKSQAILRLRTAIGRNWPGAIG